MPEIHPTAVVEPGAVLAEDVRVGPFCWVGPKANIGAGTRLIAHATVTGRTTLGEHNTVWPNAVVGGDPQDLKFAGEDTELRVGDHNEIRECVTLHRGTANDGGVTTVGDHNLLMAYTHVAHDCRVGNHVVLANGVQIAGHVLVEDHVTIGGASAIHHFVTIGGHGFIGGMTRVTKDSPPFMILEGNPAEIRRLNSVGLKRQGIAEDSRLHLRDAFRKLYSSRADSGGVGRTDAACDALLTAYPDDPHVARLVTSVRNSASGQHGRYLETFRRDNVWRSAPAPPG